MTFAVKVRVEKPHVASDAGWATLCHAAQAFGAREVLWEYDPPAAGPEIELRFRVAGDSTDQVERSVRRVFEQWGHAVLAVAVRIV